jgi:hypothetical protein
MKIHGPLLLGLAMVMALPAGAAEAQRYMSRAKVGGYQLPMTSVRPASRRGIARVRAVKRVPAQPRAPRTRAHARARFEMAQGRVAQGRVLMARGKFRRVQRTERPAEID